MAEYRVQYLGNEGDPHLPGVDCEAWTEVEADSPEQAIVAWGEETGDDVLDGEIYAIDLVREPMRYVVRQDAFTVEPLVAAHEPIFQTLADEVEAFISQDSRPTLILRYQKSPVDMISHRRIIPVSLDRARGLFGAYDLSADSTYKSFDLSKVLSLGQAAS